MTHDELLERIKDPSELSRWLDKGVADKEITLSQAQIYWHNTNALRAVVELHKPTDDGLGCSYEFIECHDGTGLGCDIPRTCNQYKPYPCSTIQAIEKELG